MAINQQHRRAARIKTVQPDFRGGLPQLSFSIRQFMAHSGMGRSQIYECLRNGKLKAIKIGARTFIPAAAAHKLIASAKPATFSPASG
jgi:hypothetical protein